jgi:hypothetical protein
MTNKARDKRLTEAMGLCWHECIYRATTYEEAKLSGLNYIYYCPNCNKEDVQMFSNMSFSTWPGFGVLKGWAEKREWWEAFVASMWELTEPVCRVPWSRLDIMLSIMTNPDPFADALDSFLQTREG